MAWTPTSDTLRKPGDEYDLLMQKMLGRLYEPVRRRQDELRETADASSVVSTGADNLPIAHTTPECDMCSAEAAWSDSHGFHYCDAHLREEIKRGGCLSQREVDETIDSGILAGYLFKQ